MSSPSYRPARRQVARWSTVVLCVAFGVVYAVIGIAHHDVAFAVGGGAVMVLYGAALIVFARRSETVSMLGRPPADERQASLQIQALAITGGVLVTVLVGAMIWALAVGAAQAPMLSALCAVAGLSFIGSTAWLSHRR